MAAWSEAKRKAWRGLERGDPSAAAAVARALVDLGEFTSDDHRGLVKMQDTSEQVEDLYRQLAKLPKAKPVPRRIVIVDPDLAGRA